MPIVSRVSNTPSACPLMPAIPRIPPLWRESRIGLEAAALRRSPVYDGLGVPAGRAPPGPADPRLHGRRPVARHDGRAGCGATAIAPTARASAPTSTAPRRPAARLEARLEHMAERHGERVVVIGQSRGGVFAKALGARRPGARRRASSRSARRSSPSSPSTRSCSPRSGSSARSAPRACPGMFSHRLPAREVLRALPRRARGPVPGGRRLRRASTRSSDGIVQWESCLDPAADELVEVSRLALRDGRQRPGLPRRRGRARALPRATTRCSRTICRARPRARKSTAALRGECGVPRRLRGRRVCWIR